MAPVLLNMLIFPFLTIIIDADLLKRCDLRCDLTRANQRISFPKKYLYFWGGKNDDELLSAHFPEILVNLSQLIRFFSTRKHQKISCFKQNLFTCSNNRNTRTRCEICSKLHHMRRSGVFIVNYDYVPHLVLVFLLLTLNM